jgi:hypothetical protein
MSRAALRPVAAVVVDDLVAVHTVRHAARLAAAAQRPLLLLVPLPGPGLSIDPAVHRVAHRRRGIDAEAILGRVDPALARHTGPVSARVVTYRPRRIRRPGLIAVLHSATRAHADVLVADARWAGRPTARGVVLLDPATGQPSSGQLEPAGHGADGDEQAGALTGSRRDGHRIRPVAVGGRLRR